MDMNFINNLKRSGAICGLLFSLLICACSDPQSALPAPPLTEVEADLHRHIAVLAADEFEGRAPGTAGEEKTVAYLRQEFAALGLQPGNGDSWFQEVPITSVDAKPSAIVVRGPGYQRELALGEEVNVGTMQQVSQVVVQDSPLVFAGYGIVAEERGWNDYAGLDVAGKTVLVLVNDPGYASQDEALFNGNRMTYYGRWTYKYEEAARQGAEAVLVVHETGAAGYPWGVIGSPEARIGLTAENRRLDLARVEGWVSQAMAEELLAAAGLDYQTMKDAAVRPDFKAADLGGLTFSVTLNSTLNSSMSKNVVARIAGAKFPDEHIIYSAHWDHLGIRPEQEGDNIYNGASDNASGTAALLAIARQFQQRRQAPLRSVLFLALTAEESGLLGSRWYAENPLYPLETTVANLNMDNIYGTLDGRTTEVAVVGHGYSELEDYLVRAAAEQGRTVVPEPSPEKGYYYRSDHFNFARAGVPALDTTRSNASREHGKVWGQDRLDDYTANIYHQPGDEYSPDWDLSGSAQEALLFYQVGSSLADSRDFPNWSAASEFRAERDRSSARRTLILSGE